MPTHPKSTCNTWIIDGDGRVVNQLYQTLVQKLSPDCPEWPWAHADKTLTGKIMKMANMSARAFMAVRGIQLALLRTRADRMLPPVWDNPVLLLSYHSHTFILFHTFAYFSRIQESRQNTFGRLQRMKNDAK